MGKKSSKSIKGINIKTGEEIFFNKIQDAESDGFRPSNISACLVGRSKYHKGYYWHYVDLGIIPVQGRGFVWTDEEIKILKENYGLCNTGELAKKLNKSVRAVQRYARKLKIKSAGTGRSYNRVWTKTETEYLIKNYEFGNVNEIAKYLNRSRKSITERAKILKIIRDKETVRVSSRKHSVNECYFKTWSSNMAYILGLICTDGNLCKTSNRISISLHKQDTYLLEKVNKEIGHNGPIIFPKNKEMSVLSVESKPMYQDLLNLGITPCKSLTLKMPTIPKEYLADFIRGSLDGDGSVGKKYSAKICSASKDFASGLSNALNDLDIGHKMYIKESDRSDRATMYDVVILRKKELKKLYNTLYTGAELYMDRKKQRFIDWGVENYNFTYKTHKRKPVIGIDISGNVVKFDYISLAQKSGFQNIYRYIEKNKYYKGYKWQYI